MSCFINRKEVNGCEETKQVMTYRMLSEKEGCVNGCCSGINYVYAEEYPAPGIHDDQEGFLVIDGTGWAKVGEEEFRIEPDMCYIAPKDVAHCIKKDSEVEFVKIFWFHSAV
jgi:Mannose-6-phosphate isomerase